MKTDEKQIAALLHQPSEGLQVELKTWLDPRNDESVAKLVKAIFAIRNRNGGFLVIGVDDATHLPDSYALDEDVGTLYHVDTIQGLISRFASVRFEIEVALCKRDGQLHPVIVVPEGVRVPVIVERDLIGNGGKQLLQKGDVYFRTLQSNGTPSSARLLPADYPELFDICFENREADIGRFLRRHLSGFDGHAVEILRGTGSADPMQRFRDRSFALIEEGTDGVIAAADQRGVVAELQRVQSALTMRVGLVLDPAKPGELPTKEFMNKVSASNPQYTGWPIWLDSRGFNEKGHRPYVSNGAWQALIVHLGEGWSKHFDFQRFDPKGEFYLQRVMPDDLSNKVAPGTAVDVVLMIYRVAEVLAVGVSIARTLGWDPKATAYFAFRWTGLNGRNLSSWVNALNWGDGAGGQSHSEAAEAFVRVPLEVSHSALAPHVADAVGLLFVLFDGYTPSQELIETCVRKMIERRMDT